ncbi:MAG: maltose ABC transporter substrate-binding protein [Dactylosporangium sp.]|nr:maltose ABC transporter substrate-binding protein [Dactylosporangium sp.]NNJ60521.1 maltose ABC transporter substrate-binding protein [Dactylosporangium sp.]
MRIRTAGVTAAITLTLLASACGGSDDTATNDASARTDGNLVIWADDKRTEALRPFAEQFGTDNGLTVEVQAVSKDLQTNFVTASQSGKAPDVVVGAHDWIGNLVQNGAIDPVQLSAAQQQAFSDLAMQGVSYNGQIYGIPYAIENLALIRNTELAPTAPATIEDLVATGQRLGTAGKTSEIMALQVGENGDAYHIYPLYTSAGGSLFGVKDNGDYDPKDLGVAKPEAVEAFKKIAALGEKGAGALKRSITPENAIATFTSKKTAFLVSGPWALTDVKKAGITYEVTPVPGFAGGSVARPFVGVQTFYVATKGQNKVAAQEFVTNYVTRTDLAKALYDAEPRPPALTAALDQVASSDPDAMAFLEAGKDGTILPAIPEMAAIWDPFGKAEAAVIGGADPATAIPAAATAISDKIK